MIARFYPDSFFLMISNNIFLQNTAAFAGCLDFEVDIGIIQFEENLFLYNNVDISGAAGAASVIVLNGKSIMMIGKNNSYIGNYGFLQGELIIILYFLSFLTGTIIMQGANFSENNSFFSGF